MIGFKVVLSSFRVEEVKLLVLVQNFPSKAIMSWCTCIYVGKGMWSQKIFRSGFEIMSATFLCDDSHIIPIVSK